MESWAARVAHQVNAYPERGGRTQHDGAKVINPENVGRRGARWLTAKRAAFALWGTDCWICGHVNAFEADHVVRLADGGDPYNPENIRPAHGSNAPCPVCISPSTGRARCCNQERNRRPRPERCQLTVDPRAL